VKAGETREDNGAKCHEGENDTNFKRLACHLNVEVRNTRDPEGRGAHAENHTKHTGPKLSPPEVIETRPASMLTQT
jgi:hypothetical protein